MAGIATTAGPSGPSPGTGRSGGGASRAGAAPAGSSASDLATTGYDLAGQISLAVLLTLAGMGMVALATMHVGHDKPRHG